MSGVALRKLKYRDRSRYPLTCGYTLGTSAIVTGS